MHPTTACASQSIRNCARSILNNLGKRNTVDTCFSDNFHTLAGWFSSDVMTTRNDVMHYNNALLALITVIALIGCAPSKPPPSAPAPPPVTEPEPVVPDTLPSVQFESGQVELTAAQRDQVREIAKVLKIPSVLSQPVRVFGHTDDRGSEKGNKEVGLKRAEAVARELVFNGIASERLVVDSMGETEPVAPNKLPDGSDNPDGRALNRRVDVVIQN